MRLIDEQYLKTPFYGSRRMTAHLERSGEAVNRKRVRRLMALMGLEGLDPVRRTTVADPGAGLPVPAPRPGVDPGGRGLEFGYHLCADEAGVHVPDGGDRLVQPVRALVAAVEYDGRGVLPGGAGRGASRGRPEIFNTDQGSQFTSREYTGRLEAAGIAVSRDGRGRALDNVFVERLWRSVKYEDIYIKDYDNVVALEAGLSAYFRFYDEDRPHQSLGYRTPGRGLSGRDLPSDRRGRILTYPGPRTVQFSGSTSRYSERAHTARGVSDSGRSPLECDTRNEPRPSPRVVRFPDEVNGNVHLQDDPDNATATPVPPPCLQPPGGIGEGLIQVGRLEIRVGLEDTLARLARGEQPDDGPDRHPQATDAGFPSLSDHA